MQIRGGLYQLSGSLNGLSWCGGYGNYEDCNVYLLRGEGGYILFDCGCGETWEQLDANMRYWGIDPAEIRACFLTHAHLDHSGAAHLLAERGIALYAHEQTAQALASGDERCAGYLYHKRFTPCRVDYPMRDGDTVSVCGVEIRLMHCPGHTAGCSAFLFCHEGARVVVSGDIIGTLLDGFSGWDGSIDFDRQVYLKSLQAFAKVDSDLMLPGHGMVYFHEPKRRVEDALCLALSNWR